MRLPLFEVHKYSILIITILLFIKKVLNKNCHPTPQNNVIWIPTILNVVSYKNIYMKKNTQKFHCTLSFTHKKILPSLSPKTTQHKKPIDNDYWLKICTKIVMLIKTSDKIEWKKLKRMMSLFSGIIFSQFFPWNDCSVYSEIAHK